MISEWETGGKERLEEGSLIDLMFIFHSSLNLNKNLLLLLA